jgi:hypothetical protein
MKRIKHTEIKDIVATASGDFCFVTAHTATGNDIRWVYWLHLKSYETNGVRGV